MGEVQNVNTGDVLWIVVGSAEVHWVSDALFDELAGDWARLH
jgi:hypothetical protein